METSALAPMMTLPREGHLCVVYQMFAFIKIRHNGVVVFNLTEPEIDESTFKREDWTTTLYGACKEDVPLNAPEPLGIVFIICAFVNSDHAGDMVTCRSRTGFMIFLNNVPTYWYSKKQRSCDISSFGSEFFTMKSCCKDLRGLQYKSQMMGIPVEFPSFVCGDNQPILVNSSQLHSSL